ncbi:MAG TPA: quinolinate synthase NadA, partial [Alphaproteobacteria bacterium]|nr:quinolinate synthase NadA [Alphaproteobacteria bacterium]
VLAEADYVGSTAGMQNYVETKKPGKVILITECAMSDNLRAANPGTEFTQPCNLCPHMQRITLPKILASLQNEGPEVHIDPAIAERARASVDRMLAVK